MQYNAITPKESVLLGCYFRPFRIKAVHSYKNSETNHTLLSGHILELSTHSYSHVSLKSKYSSIQPCIAQNSQINIIRLQQITR